MSNRKIKIYTTLGSPGTIETTAVNLADLKPELSVRGINTSGMKLLIGETRNELSEDTALLPEGDFKLYLVPSQTKSGSVSNIELVKSLLKAAIAILDEMESSNLSVKTMSEDELRAAKEISEMISNREEDDEY